MFPEYRTLITTLKQSDQHFTRLFDQHNDLDQKIKNMEVQIEPGTGVEIENLKLPDGLAKSMEADVHRWGVGAIGCADADGGGWSPNAPNPASEPTKPAHKKGRST